jgi:hypothetical protein
VVTPSQEMYGEPKLPFASGIFVPSHAELFNILKQNSEKNKTAGNKF